MAGLFDLYKTWIDDETLYTADLNNSFSDIRDNMVSDKVEGYSTINNVPNDSRFDSVVNPYLNGARNYASSVAGEIERLRYQLSAITGNTWYLPPSIDLQTGLTEASVVMPWFFPSASAVSDLPERDIMPYRGQQCAGITTTATVTNYNNARFPLGMNRNKKLTFSFRANAPTVSTTLAYIPTMGIIVNIDVNGLPHLKLTTWAPSTDSAKTLIDIAGTNTVYGPGIHYYTVMLDWSTDPGANTIYFYIDGVLVGSNTTATLGYPEYGSHFLYINSTPSLPTVSGTLAFKTNDPTMWPAGWSAVGSAAALSFPNGGGITFQSGGASTAGFQLASVPGTVDTVLRVTGANMSAVGTNSVTSGFGMTLSSAYTSGHYIQAYVFFYDDCMVIQDGISPGAGYTVKMDCGNWHRYTFRFNGTPGSGQNILAYVDNILVGTVPLTDNSLSSSDFVTFGYINDGVPSPAWNGTMDMVYLSYSATSYNNSFSGCSNRWDGVLAINSAFDPNGTVPTALNSVSPASQFSRVLPVSRAYSNFYMKPAIGSLSGTTGGGAVQFTLGEHVYSDGQKPLRVTVSGELNITGGSSTIVYLSIFLDPFFTGTGAIPLTTTMFPYIKIPGQIIGGANGSVNTINIDYPFFLPAGVYNPSINMIVTGSSGAASILVRSLDVMFSYDGDIT